MKSIFSILSAIFKDAGKNSDWADCNVDSAPLPGNLMVDPTISVNGDAEPVLSTPRATSTPTIDVTIDPTISVDGDTEPVFSTPRATSTPTIDVDDARAKEIILNAMAAYKSGEGTSATFKLSAGDDVTPISITIEPSKNGSQRASYFPEPKGFFGSEAQQIKHGFRECGDMIGNTGFFVGCILFFVGVNSFGPAASGIMSSISEETVMWIKYARVLLLVFHVATPAVVIKVAYSFHKHLEERRTNYSNGHGKLILPESRRQSSF